MQVTADPSDTTAQLLGEVGLQLNPAVTALPRQGGSGAGAGGANVAFEQLGTLDSDLLITTSSGPQLRSALESSPLFQRLPAVQDGRHLHVDLTVVSTPRLPTVASIPWAMTQLEPLFTSIDR